MSCSSISLGSENVGGEGGKGRIMDVSRLPLPLSVERRGREDRVCVLDRRREVQMQW